MYSRARGLSIVLMMIGTSIYWIRGVLNEPSFQNINWQSNIFLLSILAYLILYPEKRLTFFLCLSLILLLILWIKIPPNFLDIQRFSQYFNDKSIFLYIFLAAIFLGILMRRVLSFTTIVILTLLAAAWFVYTDFKLLAVITLLMIPALLFVFSGIFFRSSKTIKDIPKKQKGRKVSKKGKGRREPFQKTGKGEGEPIPQSGEDRGSYSHLHEYPGQEPMTSAYQGVEPTPRTLEERILYKFQSIFRPLLFVIKYKYLVLEKLLFWTLLSTLVITFIVFISNQYAQEMYATMIALFLWVLLFVSSWHSVIKKYQR